MVQSIDPMTPIVNDLRDVPSVSNELDMRDRLSVRCPIAWMTLNAWRLNRILGSATRARDALSADAKGISSP